MQTYRFSFIVEGELTDDSDQQLFEACAGNTATATNHGVWQLHFVRESECLEVAIASARKQVLACGLQISELVMNADALFELQGAVLTRVAVPEDVPVGM